MMYDVGDKVMMFWEDELYHEEVEVTWVSDDEEMFDLTGENENEFKGVPRANIFYEYELDKLAMCMVEGEVEVLEKIADNEYLEQVYNKEENDWVTVLSDVSLEALVESIVGNLDSIESVLDWFGKLTSYYGEDALLYCEEDKSYHVILVG